MSINKRGYFQGGGGVNEPTIGKKKYKSDTAILVQPRFEEPLFYNYDLYETDGVNGQAKHGPGGGFYQNMDKYKSVKEFLDSKRKRNKDKYKADDFYIEDNNSNYKERVNRMKIRASWFNKIIKGANKSDVNNIDFPIDDQIGSGSILGNSGAYGDSIPIGGQLDEYLTMPDFEGKSVDQLNFGRDYAEDEQREAVLDDDKMQGFMAKYLNHKENELYGLPDGIDPSEDLDADKTINDENPYYGTTESGNTLYNKMYI